MSYQYSTERETLFSEKGSVLFTSIRDNVKRLLKTAGAVRMQEAMSGNTGDSWLMLACVDRMVELNELRELTKNVPGQDRVFVAYQDGV